MTPTPIAALRGQARRQGWERLSHGLHLPAGIHSTTELLHAWSLVLPPGSAFTHLTAARLRGWWLPAEVEHPVFAATWDTTTCVQRAGLRVTRHREPLPVVPHRELRVTSAPETLLAMARDLSLLDLVILGDSALHLGHCTPEDLQRGAASRRWGAPRLRLALPLLDGRSESAWESVLRMLHRAADVPVEPQHEVRDESGRTVGYGDLWIIGTRRLHEYDGEGHREKGQYHSDRRRERRLVELEWQRVGFVAGQVLHEAGDIVAGLDRLLGRTWDPRRLTRWQQLVGDSLLSPAGRARARTRWS